MTRVFISAGEASGDLHASSLIRELKARTDGLEFFGLGGELMRSEGAELWYDLKVLAVTGFWEVVKRYFEFRRVFYDVLERIDQVKPDVAILVDYPGFNLRIAEKLHQRGIKVIYFIAPQVWAWKKKRVIKMERDVDLLISVFPFEEQFFAKTKLRCKFVGHPLLDQIDSSESAAAFKTTHRIENDDKIVALLPGSRPNEVESHYGTMLDAVGLLRETVPNLRVFVLVREEIGAAVYDHIEQTRFGLRVERIGDDRYGLLKAADVAIVKSGTSTVETALCGAPFCVVYRTGWITYQIARRVIKLSHVGMVNIIAAEQVVPEFLQYDMNPTKLAEFCRRILTVKAEREEMKTALLRVRDKLGEPGAAGRAADAVLAEL